MSPIVLRTPRLELSAPTDADVEPIFVACQDPAIQRYTTVPAPYQRHHAEEFVTKVAGGWERADELTWAMRDGDTLVGMIGLYHLDGHGSGELGYWVAAPARGRGFIVEASRAVLDVGFGPALRLERIEWHAVAGNTASARTARALGFRYEGLQRRALRGKDGREDRWAAGLLADDDRVPQPWPVLED